MDPRTEKMGEILVNYSVSVKPGQWVAIRSELAGEPLAAACARAVLRAGGKPTVLFQSEMVEEIILGEANDEQLAWVPPIFPMVIEQADASISLMAPTNTRALAGVDSSRIAFRNQAMTSVMETFMQRSASGALQWTAAVYPTIAAAQDAGMSLHDYEDFVYNAGLLNEPDPVAAWKQLGERQQRIIDWLQSRSEVHITGPGTDLKIGVKDRVWLNDDGHKNFPGGEVFTGPVEDSAEGTIQFNFPGFYNGREVAGVRLTFTGGKVTEATATGDEEFLHQMLAMDEGATRLGEFAFGTNFGIKRMTKNVLFDEKIGGSLHMALGRAYPETGGTNVSALHWDMVYDLHHDAEVTVDGETLSRKGEFCI